MDLLVHQRMPNASGRILVETCEELLAAEERGIHARLREIEDFVLSRLKDLSGLLAGEIPRATAALAKHSRDIPLTPEGKTYRRSGEWDLLGVRSDGAGGQNCRLQPQIEFRLRVAAWQLERNLPVAAWIN
jgi:hypothetical protein